MRCEEGSSDGDGRGRKKGKRAGGSESISKKHIESGTEKFTKAKASIAKRDALTAKMFRELNKVVFEGRLPHDLQITWNARLNTTAGYTIFARPRPGEALGPASTPPPLSPPLPLSRYLHLSFLSDIQEQLRLPRLQTLNPHPQP